MMDSERDDSSRYDHDQAASVAGSSRQNQRRDAAASPSNPDQTGICCHNFGLFCFKAKERTKITALEYKLKSRQKKFGVDYLTLVERNASQQELKRCLRNAMDEIEQLQEEIEERLLSIEGREDEIKDADDKVTREKSRGSGQSRGETVQASADETTSLGSPKKKATKKKDIERPTFTIDSDEEKNCESEQPKKIVKKKKKKSQKSSST